MQRSSIEWTDWTANPIKYRDANGKSVWACVKHSPGCAHCYAETLAKRYGRGGPFTRQALEQVTPYACEDELRAILRSKPMAGQKCFIGDMTDVFGEWVTDAMLDRMFAVFALRRDVTFQVLTKRAGRMRDYLISRSKSARPWKDAARSLGWSLEFEGHSLVPYPLPNVHVGFSAENQECFDRRSVDAAEVMRLGWLVFVSAEPLLGPILMTGWDGEIQRNWLGKLGIGWVIVGGESGPGARPCNWSWMKSVVEQCQAASVPVFVKQLGAVSVVDVNFPAPKWNRSFSAPVVIEDGRCRVRLADRKGKNPEEWPADLRVRQWPEARGLTIAKE